MLISICIHCLINAIFLLRNLPFCLNRSCPDLIHFLPFLSNRQQQKSIDSNKSICALSVFFPLSLAIALLSTGKSLLSVLYMTVDRLNPSFLPENLTKYQTFSAGAERGSDSETRLGTRIGEITYNI